MYIDPPQPYMFELKRPKTTRFICAIEEYAIIRFKSLWRIVVNEAYITLIIANESTNGAKNDDPYQNNGIVKRRRP